MLGFSAEAETGWYTYLIRKKRPFGARYAAYRLTLRLSDFVGAAVLSLIAGVRHSIMRSFTLSAHALRRMLG